jgi:hypothetical protein
MISPVIETRGAVMPRKRARATILTADSISLCGGTKSTMNPELFQMRDLLSRFRSQRKEYGK